MRARKSLFCFLLAASLAALVSGSASAQEFDEWDESIPFDGTSFGPPPALIWGNIEFLGWWRKGRETPPLVTIGDPADAVPGAIGEPGTQLLFGGDRIGERIRPGGRINLGVWIDPYETVGVGLNFYGLGEQTTRFNVSSDGAPLLAIPFFDPGFVTNALVVAQAGQPGSIAIRSSADMFGGDLYLRGYAMQGYEVRIDWLAGYQTARIDEDLVIAADSPGNFFVQDSFATKNEFHGGSLGLSGQWWRGPWVAELFVKVGMGSMRQTVTVTGLNDLGQIGGLFVEGVDVAEFKRSHFAVVPETSLKVGYNLNPNARVSLTYSYIYFSNVVQPGDQIDTVVGDGLDSAAFADHGYWAHGLGLSLDWRF